MNKAFCFVFSFLFFSCASHLNYQTPASGKKRQSVIRKEFKRSQKKMNKYRKYKAR